MMAVKYEMVADPTVRGRLFRRVVKMDTAVCGREFKVVRVEQNVYVLMGAPKAVALFRHRLHRDIVASGKGGLPLL